MQFHRRHIRGFSLVEVVLAVGIFTAAVVVMVALLPSLSRQAAVSADTLTALRLPDAIRTELQRLAVTGGFDNLARQTAPMASPLPATLMLVAARDATQVKSLAYLPPAAADLAAQDQQFFMIEAWTFNSAPLAFDPAAAVLVLHVRVSWPYYARGSATPTPLSDREMVAFNVALNR